MRLETLTLNLSIKYNLKIVSKTKMKNCRSMIDQGLHCAYTVNLESLKTLYKKKIYIYIYFLKQICWNFKLNECMSKRQAVRGAPHVQKWNKIYYHPPKLYKVHVNNLPGFSPGDIKMLGWCPVGPVLPHGEKVPI